MLLVAFVFVLSTGVGGAVREANPSDSHLIVSFGKPTYVQFLRYEEIYAKKSFPDALLFYYDNGIYKIISPGEEHYGVFVIDGSFDDERYTIHYASLPSPDWGDAAAYHVLTFDSRSDRFEQNAVVPIDGRLPQQYGRFEVSENIIADPTSVNWKNSKRFMPWSVE
ncbi:hypothetical protein KXS07_25000 [Inquilinus limosus]|uniref:hypothetical protein n=1 Tax=Inquilinus limosus TaxID=171674 RepID=UPI003F18C747